MIKKINEFIFKMIIISLVCAKASFFEFIFCSVNFLLPSIVDFYYIHTNLLKILLFIITLLIFYLLLFFLKRNLIVSFI